MTLGVKERKVLGYLGGRFCRQREAMQILSGENMSGGFEEH